MKHGRRHASLKEKVYRERFQQDAEGYGRPFRSIDVREGSGEPMPREESATSLGTALPRKAKRDLRRLGVEPEAPDEA